MGGRGLGKAQLLLEYLLKGGLGCVISQSEATGDTDDVLRASSPKLIVYFSADESVECPIVHLLGRMLI